ncbi:type II toxin-antitoxin system Phd/YefM family antitoxin [Methylomonas sp. SURF-2]|uniref:Antitoxin n=1 Tax=Methylomonas subterranea TaxID=2952225 RepID=A0ABT1TJY9_9GAMM|nr:type II toxin-antitoxin system Phd/YefM family antitoxin [Methylomonas sp. SURF-2]MCQ8105792.1 type II toxin-antitoxin system Phd/YefM family antitoxin [Methylomonas sp. SURF-2]
MNLVTDIKPVSYLKAHSAELLQQINQTHRPIVITQNGEPRGVLQDAESYENMRNALSLLKLLAQSEEDIRHGDLLDQQDVFREMDELLVE